MSNAPVKRGWTTMRSSLDRSSTMSFARRHARTMTVPATRRAKSAGVLSRRTSALVMTTRSMRAPATSSSRSRAIVSVSGSSGTSAAGLRANATRQLSPADVAAELLAREFDGSSQILAPALRVVHRITKTGHSEHAAARCHERSGRIALGAGVKYESLVRNLGNQNSVAAAWLIGIARRREHGCHSRTRCSERRLRQFVATSDSVHQVRDPGGVRQCGKNRLRLWIPKTAIEL